MHSGVITQTTVALELMSLGGSNAAAAPKGFAAAIPRPKNVASVRPGAWDEGEDETTVFRLVDNLRHAPMFRQWGINE